MTFTPDTIFTRSPDPLTTEVDGETVMMDVESGSYFNLDRIGSAIWARLENPVRFDDLCRDLHAIYDAPLDTIRADVAALLSRMLSHKLVRTDTP
ncbi:PqqD family peptide modification chaperone [Niveispirillum sp. KHB5.9]|uniref:PqqD family peptide modification chaperone n=1 Tax=Niveispirillum sp. KHB5.9 TaxID=3400269 RepID=UPI003A8AF009